LPIAAIIDLTESKTIEIMDRKELDESLRSMIQMVYKRFEKNCLAKPTLTQGDSIELLVNNWKPIIFLFHKILLMELDFKVGLGTSTIHLFRENADECDGPAFWNAREALEEIKKMKRKKVIASFKVESGTPKDEIIYITSSILFLTNLKMLTLSQLKYCYYYMWERKKISEIAEITKTSKGNVSKNLSKTQCYTLTRLISWLEA